MENKYEELIMENKTIHTQSLSSRYVNSLSSNFKALIIFVSILAAILVIFAVTGFYLAWIPFGLVLICITLIVLVNIRSITAGKKILSKFEGTIYEYKFYETYVSVKYTLDDQSGEEDILYKNFRSASRINAVLAIVLTNNSLLFIDEYTITDGEAYNKLINIIKKYTDVTYTKRRKRNKKQGNIND